MVVVYAIEGGWSEALTLEDSGLLMIVTGSSKFKSLKQCSVSLKEIPYEFIKIVKMDSKSAQGAFNGGNPSSTPLGLNSHYFSVPLSCIFAKELIDHTYDSNELDPKVILKFY